VISDITLTAYFLWIPGASFKGHSQTSDIKSDGVSQNVLKASSISHLRSFWETQSSRAITGKSMLSLKQCNIFAW